jgi:hypothetical protein
VRTLAPQTEAQPAAILLQWLAAFGNVLGPSPTARSATDYGDRAAEEETAEPKKFLQEETLVRIVRTFEPFPEPILLRLTLCSGLGDKRQYNLYRSTRHRSNAESGIAPFVLVLRKTSPR